jgi:hypothetical protein
LNLELIDECFGKKVSATCLDSFATRRAASFDFQPFGEASRAKNVAIIQHDGVPAFSTHWLLKHIKAYQAVKVPTDVSVDE